MTYSLTIPEEIIAAYYQKSLSLEAVNHRREDRGLPRIEKLGGLTFEQKKKLGMIEPRHEGWEYDGQNYHLVKEYV